MRIQSIKKNSYNNSTIKQSTNPNFKANVYVEIGRSCSKGKDEFCKTVLKRVGQVCVAEAKATDGFGEYQGAHWVFDEKRRVVGCLVIDKTTKEGAEAASKSPDSPYGVVFSGFGDFVQRVLASTETKRIKLSEDTKIDCIECWGGRGKGQNPALSTFN